MVPEVSVLLPYRDAAPTLEVALESVLAQRGVELEVLCVDDGSRDTGPALVARRAARDRRVIPLATPGVGIVGALEHARAAARAALIARMDADDVCLPERLALQRDALSRAPGLGALGTQIELLVDAGEVSEGLARYVAWQNALVSPADHARELFVESPLCHPSVMLPREALARVGGWHESPWAEDYDLWLRLDAAGYALAKVPAVLFRWRRHAGQLTFRDPRYTLPRFHLARALYLAPRLRARGLPVVFWGAGPTGRRLARAFESHGVRASAFVDIDPRKIGRTARDAPIVPPEALVRGAQTVVVAVGARGARALIRAQLSERGFVEGEDFVCAS